MELTKKIGSILGDKYDADFYCGETGIGALVRTVITHIDGRTVLDETSKTTLERAKKEAKTKLGRLEGE